PNPSPAAPHPADEPHGPPHARGETAVRISADRVGPAWSPSRALCEPASVSYGPVDAPRVASASLVKAQVDLDALSTLGRSPHPQRGRSGGRTGGPGGYVFAGDGGWSSFRAVPPERSSPQESAHVSGPMIVEPPSDDGGAMPSGQRAVCALRRSGIDLL